MKSVSLPELPPRSQLVMPPENKLEKDMSSEITLLDKLTKAIAFAYKTDKTAPGVTVAALPKGQYYCSVVRYDSAFGKGKKVVCSAQGDTIGAAVKATADLFLIRFVKPVKIKDPLEELDDQLAADRKAVRDAGGFLK